MAAIELTVNGERRTADVDPATPLLWVLRDEFGLTGTKFGCGIAQCGACTVRLDGDAVRSCVTPLSRAAGRRVTTIEGLSEGKRHAVQQAWLDEQVPQCGFCTPGFVMATKAFCDKNPGATLDQVRKGLGGNICRCGTYVRIRRAVHRAALLAKGRR